MKKITILMLHLLHGGIEKQTITLANELSQKYDVEIISTYSMGSTPAYEVSPSVKIKYLIDDAPNREEFKLAIKKKNIFGILKEGLKAVRILYLKTALMTREIRKLDCDFVLSTRAEFAGLLSKYAPKKVTTITQEHLHDDSPRYVKRCQKAFKNLDYLVVLCDGSERNFKRWLKGNKKIKIVKIPNILEHIPENAAKLSGCQIISVGRLHPVKNFPALLKIFAQVQKELPDAKLTIVGDGTEKDSLERLAKELSISSSVTFTGMLSKEQVQEKMLCSDVYVMTSLTECFPMVLLEAAAVGLPLVSYDVPVGPAAIISNGQNGALIPDGAADMMTQTIVEILRNNEYKQGLGKKAREGAYQYLPKYIMPLWYDLFDR